MAETATTFRQLLETRPLPDEPVAEGYQHLNLLKQVLKTQFTGGGSGGGLDAPVTVTAAELNYLADLTGNIQAQINAIISGGGDSFPSGCKMVFGNYTLPPGWSQDTSFNATDAVIRMTASTAGQGAAAGTIGGEDSPLTPFVWAHNHNGATGSTVLTVNQMPVHSHRLFSNSEANNIGTPSGNDSVAIQGDYGADHEFNYSLGDGSGSINSGRSDTQGANAGHNHSIPVDGGGEAYHLKYINAIWGVKS